MIKIIATSIIKEGKEQEFLAIAKTLVEKSQQEPGNIFYTINQNIENPRQFCFLECWKDQEAIDCHNKSEHYTTLVPKLGELREKGTLEIYKEL